MPSLATSHLSTKPTKSAPPKIQIHPPLFDRFVDFSPTINHHKPSKRDHQPTNSPSFTASWPLTMNQPTITVPTISTTHPDQPSTTTTATCVGHGRDVTRFIATAVRSGAVLVQPALGRTLRAQLQRHSSSSQRSWEDTAVVGWVAGWLSWWWSWCSWELMYDWVGTIELVYNWMVQVAPISQIAWLFKTQKF